MIFASGGVQLSYVGRELREKIIRAHPHKKIKNVRANLMLCGKGIHVLPRPYSREFTIFVIYRLLPIERVVLERKNVCACVCVYVCMCVCACESE